MATTRIGQVFLQLQPFVGCHGGRALRRRVKMLVFGNSAAANAYLSLIRNTHGRLFLQHCGPIKSDLGYASDRPQSRRSTLMMAA
jgi:hypothetical protein